MSATTVAAALLAAGLIDSAFSGFRSALGRNALLDHRRQDWLGVRTGLALGLVGLAPVVALTVISLATEAVDMERYRLGGIRMLWVVGPYSILMLTTIGAYAVMPWRVKFLATSLILGPLSLMRGPIALGGAMAAAITGGDIWVTVVAFSAATVILAVEPISARLVADRVGDGASSGPEAPITSRASSRRAGG